jgi:geranylgeranyl diphosphate synthase type I
MPLIDLSKDMLPRIEEELASVVQHAKTNGMEQLRSMLAYHMGWEEGRQNAHGKRIRPLLVLLTTSAAGGEWENALPAAAAVELVHNFSLIHDDIQDGSELRRGRPTVWKIWGMPQAINAGDAMFALAHLATLRLTKTASSEIAISSSHLLLETCLELTKGQFLDIGYQDRNDLTIDDYWPMVRGKTAALLAACTELGAIVAGTASAARIAFHSFGQSLGLAFQAHDDFLGIWGDAALTGKSSESDLITGKKSLPVLYGLTQKGQFAKRWLEGPITPEEVPALAHLLELEGALRYTQETTARLTQQSLDALDATKAENAARDALEELAHQLLTRKG